MPIRQGGRRSLRERDFHRWLRTHLPAGQRGLLPLGDDAAALPVGPHRVVLLSSDALVDGVHFVRSTPGRRIGEAAAAVNLSDIAAKGGVPAALLIDLLVPVGTPAAWARSVVRGAESVAARYGCHVVGGDTKPSRTRAVIGTVLGWAASADIPTRGGARPGDVVVTTGWVGHGGAFRSNISRLLRVQPRIREGWVLGPAAHAMTDTSDGIAEGARLLAAASGHRLVLRADQLPLHPRLRRAGAPTARQLEAAFYGGDYELLATVDPAAVPGLVRALHRLHCRLSVVGRVERGRGVWLQGRGPPAPMPRFGWRHFEAR